jgi:hypothetical protein
VVVLGDTGTSSADACHNSVFSGTAGDHPSIWQQRDPFPGRAGMQFRRVNDHLHLPALRAALEREIAEPVGSDVHNDEVSAA